MLHVMRTKFGPGLVGSIIGLIAFVFIFYGVFSPSRTRGLQEGAVAGTVNGETISLQEFGRAYNQRLEFYKQMSGGKLSEAKMKAARLKEGVFEELANQKLAGQAAHKAGLDGSDEEVRERIRQFPAFQKDGKFDTATYKMVLQANNYAPGQFEKMIREEVTLQNWQGYFRDRVRTSDFEVKREFQLANDKRTIRYVLLTAETGRKGVKVAPADIEKFLKEPSKAAMVRSQYDMKKATEYKDVAFDQARERIAHDMLAAEKSDDARKFNESLAAQVLPMLSTDKGSETKVNALLKSYGVTVKSTGSVSRLNPYLPGIGEAKELMADAFADKSPIDPAQGGKAKKYTSGGWVMVAVVQEAQKPDLAKLATEKEQLVRQLNYRKERALNEAWMKKVRDQAKIDRNPSVVEAGGEGA